MLRKKALRKIFITTMSIFMIMVIYLIPTTTQDILPTNLELEYITGLGNHSIYLLNQNQYLVKTKILLDSSDPIENIKTLLFNLTISSSTKFPEYLMAIIPQNTKVLSVTVEDKNATINFSKELLKVSQETEEKMIEAIVYSVTELSEIDGVRIQVEGQILSSYPNSKKPLDEVLTRKHGINKHYDFTSTKDIHKVVIYYVESLGDTSYYVPVTKYINDSRDKIQIIVEELTTSYIYEPNLMSLVNEDTELINYTQEDNVMILSFNDALFDSNGMIKEEVLYTISYSVFENYDVNVISFEVNDEVVQTIKQAELP